MTQGELDFQAVVHEGGIVLYRRAGQPGRWLVLPHALDIGTRADGTPDFQLDLVRSADGDSAAYGTVDFRMVPVVDRDAAQRAVSGDPVEPARFAGGWLRLLVREPGQTVAATLLPPIAITPTGLGVVRLAAHLSPEAATLLKRALLDGSLLVEAWAELTIRGVSPRLPAVVSVSGADLANAIELDPPSGLVSRASVRKALSRPEMVTGVPADVDREALGEAVADRLRNMAAVLAPSPGQDLAEWWRLDLRAGAIFRWDLSETVGAARIHALRFDPMGLVRQAAASGGLDRLVVHRELLEFHTGFVPVLITATLLDQRWKVLSCGVDIAAPPRPPHRLAAIRETVELEPPADRAEVVLKFAPNEPPQYRFETFLVVETDGGVCEWRLPAKPHGGGVLRLTPDDFAARFVAVSASPPLLAAGSVRAIARWDSSSQTVTLSSQRPVDALVYPADADVVTLVCRLTDGTRTVEAEVPSAPDVHLDLPVFREWGAHTVEIRIDFTNVSDVVALELKPEASPDAAAVTLSFSPSRPTRSWRWFAASPFAPGYQYRPFRNAPPFAAWSATQSAFEPLRLRSGDLVVAGMAAAEGG